MNKINNFSSNCDGTKNKNVDGTGILASVDLEIGKRIINFIKENYQDVKKILDVGAGQGFLQKAAEEEGSLKVWSMEGSNEVPFVANEEHHIIGDMTKPLGKEYNNAFDLITSFECIEHICLEDQDKFWNNVFTCAKQAFVSIHCLNEESHAHCLIRDKNWWINYFTEKNIINVLIGDPDTRWNVTPSWDCSVFFYLRKKD